MIKILYIEKKKLCAPNPKTVIDKIRMSLITNAQITGTISISSWMFSIESKELGCVSLFF